jgi:hypothetical protein
MEENYPNNMKSRKLLMLSLRNRAIEIEIRYRKLLGFTEFSGPRKSSIGFAGELRDPGISHFDRVDMRKRARLANWRELGEISKVRRSGRKWRGRTSGSKSDRRHRSSKRRTTRMFGWRMSPPVRICENDTLLENRLRI